MKVNEKFYSIQGEGHNMGQPTIFVRLAGCNINPPCEWCDTKYALSHESGELTPIAELMNYANSIRSLTGCNRVCITGGEPLVQALELKELITALVVEGFEIEIFTNGTLPVPNWARLVSWVVDVKTPSSGYVYPNGYLGDWVHSMTMEDQLKFVIADRNDLDFVLDYTNSMHEEALVIASVVISPMISGSLQELTNSQLAWFNDLVETCKNHNFMFSLQHHKILWGNKRGV